MSNTLNNENHKQHEASFDVSRSSSFAAVATTEAHTLTYVGMCLGDGPFSRSDMRKLFVDAQGNDPVWVPALNLNFSYAEDRFVPSGISRAGFEIRNVRNRKEPMEVAVVEPVHDEIAFATCGRLLDYSILPDSPPLRSVFGESREGTVGAHGASLRREVIRLLDVTPGLSEVELARQITGNASFEINSFLLDLQTKGILLRHHSSDWDKRVFKLTGRGVPSVGARHYSINDTTRALYDASDILAASGYDEITAEELFNFTRQVDPEVDPADLRQSVAAALLGRKTASGAKQNKYLQSVESPGSLRGGELTQYEINPVFKDDLHKLIDDLLTIESGDRVAIDYWVNRGIDIFTDTELVRSIVAKSASSSPHKNNLSDREFTEKVSSLIVQNGPSTVRELGALLCQVGIVMSLKGLDQKVRNLVQTGMIEIIEAPASDRNTRVVKKIIGVAPSQTTSKDLAQSAVNTD